MLPPRIPVNKNELRHDGPDSGSCPASGVGLASRLHRKGPDLLRVGFFHNLPTGGGIRVASHQLNLLAGRYDWDIEVPDGSAAFIPDPGLNPRIWPFPAGRPLRGPRRMAAPVLLYGKLMALTALCRRISADMSSSGCSVLLSHPSMILYAPPILHMLDIPRIFYCHEYPRHLYEKGATKTPNHFTEMLIGPLLQLERRLDSRNARSAAFHLCNSTYTAGKVEKIYGRKTVVVRPGVDSSFFVPGGSVTGAFVMSVGALSPLKGHDLVIRALSLIPVESRPTMLIAGDRGRPGYASALEALASRLGVGLTIHRGVSEKTMLECYRAARIVVCAQKAEPYGLVPLEAMSCCRPVVSVNEGGFPENIRDGETGLLVERRPEALAGAISRLLSSPALCRALGEAGRRFVVTERDLRSHAEAVASLIDRAAAGQSLF